MKRKKAADRQTIDTPEGRVTIATYSANGWDLWVPERIAVSSVTAHKSGTLIRLVPVK